MEEPEVDFVTPVPEPEKKPEPDRKQTTEPVKQVKTSTPKISDLKSVLKGGLKKDVQANPVAEQKLSNVFTQEELKAAWQEFTERYKGMQVTYHLLSQGFEFRDNKVIIQLHNHFQETLLDEIRLDLLTFLRERLSNDTIQLAGEIKAIKEEDLSHLYLNDKARLNRMIDKNPFVRELKDKFGLDTDV